MQYLVIYTWHSYVAVVVQFSQVLIGFLESRNCMKIQLAKVSNQDKSV